MYLHGDNLGELEYKEITAFTLLMKGKEKDHNSTIKHYRGPKPSRSTRKRERKKQNEHFLELRKLVPEALGSISSAMIHKWYLRCM
jgi:hypothetical protein